MKRLILILSILCIMFLSGCRDTWKYYGDHSDLWSESIYSILGYPGTDSDIVTIIETDQQGRTMFIFWGPNSDFFEGYYLLISQHSDLEFIYYYPDINFIASKTIYFDESEVSQLKENNDWDKQLDLEKCVKTSISDKKIRSKLSTEQRKRVIRESILKDTNDRYSHALYNIDEEGKHLFSVQILTTQSKEEGKPLFYIQIPSIQSKEEYEVYIIMVNADGSYDIDTAVEKIESLHYAQQLSLFKIKNGWKQTIGNP